MYCKLRKLRNVNKLLLLLLLLSHDAGERLDCVYCGTANLNFSHATKFPLYLSFPVISYHFLFKSKQTRKKKREVRQLIKGWVSPGNQTSDPPKEIKKDAHSPSRAYSGYTLVLLPFLESRPLPPPPPTPSPHQAARVVKKGKIKNMYIWTFWRSTDVIIKSKIKCLLLSVPENKC